ncbi:ADP-ribosyltransferase [Tindallia californiensis]|nr:ADP-ribosyltransferase [Tindallia californiensis]
MKTINKRRYGELHWTIRNKDQYIEFKNEKEARDWGMRHYSKWADTYKKMMELAGNTIKNNLCTAPIECYCGYSYRQINDYLRNGADSDEHLYREMADILSIILCSAPRIPCDVILYRLVSDEFIGNLIEENKRDRPTPIQEKGFMSTSLIKDIVKQSEAYASENNLLKIYVKKETIGVYVNSVTIRNEEEMLLFPNMFLGLSSYPYKDKECGKFIYECELIKFY